MQWKTGKRMGLNLPSRNAPPQRRLTHRPGELKRFEVWLLGGNRLILPASRSCGPNLNVLKNHLRYFPMRGGVVSLPFADSVILKTRGCHHKSNKDGNHNSFTLQWSSKESLNMPSARSLKLGSSSPLWSVPPSLPFTW